LIFLNKKLYHSIKHESKTLLKISIYLFLYSKSILKKIKIIFISNYFFIFLYRFDLLILKIIFKKIKNILF
jgi:hypothetical protein